MLITFDSDGMCKGDTDVNKKFSPRTRWSLCLDATSQFSAGTIEKAHQEEESDQLVW